MFANPQPPQIHLPRGWQGCVKSAVLYAIALDHYSIVYVRAQAADSIIARVRLAAENDCLHEECALLRKELLLKNTRMAQITPQRRPHYGVLVGNTIHRVKCAADFSGLSPEVSKQSTGHVYRGLRYR